MKAMMKEGKKKPVTIEEEYKNIPYTTDWGKTIIVIEPIKMETICNDQMLPIKEKHNNGVEYGGNRCAVPRLTADVMQRIEK